jgi:hypothetical protein
MGPDRSCRDPLPIVDEEVLRLGAEPQVYAESTLRTCRFCLESPLACVAGITVLI